MDAPEKSNNTAHSFGKSERKVGSVALPALAVGAHTTPGSGWRTSSRLGLVAAGLAVTAAVIHAVSVDGSVSSVLRSWDLPGDLAKAIDLSEVFGHGMGALAILLSVWWLAPSRRSAVWLAVAITVASGVAANGLKSLFVRVRPHATESIQIVDPTTATSPPKTSLGPSPEVLEGLELVPISVWDSRQRSFPSGHAATAWGLAIGLSLVFPRGIVLFACFATLASLQRLTSGAHFPTDILAGAAIAFVVAAGLLMLPPLRKLWL